MKTDFVCGVFAVAACYVTITQPVIASDWPQWRGPDRTGRSAETGLLKQWPKAGPPQLWKIADLGEGYGQPAIKGGRIYVQGTEKGESMVFCLNCEDGKRLWAIPLGPRLTLDKGNGPRSTPTVEAGVLYVLNEAGELACLKESDGSPVWRLNILKEFGASNPHWGISESPLVDGDRLYVTPGGRGATIVALDKRTGKTIWKSEGLSDGAAYSSCMPETIGGVRVIANFTQSAGVGVRAKDGALLWRYEKPANGTANCTSPVFFNRGDFSGVYYTSAYNTGCGMLKLTAKGDSVTGQEGYFKTDMQNHHGGVVLVDGKLYGFSQMILTCMDFETGNVLWKERSVGKGSVSYADGRLYLLGENCTAGLAEASPTGYHELGRFQIENRGEQSWAHPAISGGRLFIRNWDQMMCYEVHERGAAGNSK